MGTPIDLTGQRFGSVVAIKRSGSAEGKSVWKCVCDCGKTVDLFAKYLRNGNTKSCGCLKLKRGGLSNTGVGGSWTGMMNRCFNPKQPSYAMYGAAGRTVCEYLKASPVNLLALLGERPSKMSLDRVDNNGSYTCGSCPECKANGWPMNIRWATTLQQNRNQRDMHLLTINGETMCVSEWAEKTGLRYSTIQARLRYGFSGAALIAKPQALLSATINGQTRTLKEWSVVSGVVLDTVYQRYQDGIRGEELIRKVAA